MRRLLFLLHLYAGLSLGLIAVMSGLTGSVLVFRHEIDAALYPALLHVRPEGRSPIPLQEVLDGVGQAYPGSAPQFVYLARDATQAHVIWLKGNNAPRVYVNPYDGAILGARMPEQTVTGFLFALHTELLGGERGEKVILVSAGLLVVMSVTGLIVWWPAARKHLRAHLTVKWRASGKRVNYDLHRALGFWIAGLLCLSAITGASFVTPFEEWFANTVSAVTRTPPRPPRPKVTVPEGARPLPLDAILRRADAALPGGQRTRIALPQSASAPVVIRKRLPGELHPNGMSSVLLDPYSGRVLRVDSAWKANTGIRVLNLRYPIHIGVWGGPATRVLYALLGLMPAVLFVTGFLMWKNRTWGKGRRRRAA